MIEQVFISGQIGKAIYEQDEHYYVLGLGDYQEPVECRVGEISLFLDSGAEFSVISGKNINVDTIKSILELNKQAHRALSMTISVFDDKLSGESRSLSVEAAEEFLQDESVYAFVKNRISARPLPDMADINGAIRYAESASASVALSLYKEVLESQEAIRIVLDSWQETAQESFDSIEDESEAEKVLIEEGVFAEMVAALTARDKNRLNSLVLMYGRKPELSKTLPRATHIINALRVRLVAKLTATAEKVEFVDRNEINSDAQDWAEIEDAEIEDTVWQDSD